MLLSIAARSQPAVLGDLLGDTARAAAAVAAARASELDFLQRRTRLVCLVMPLDHVHVLAHAAVDLAQTEHAEIEEEKQQKVLRQKICKKCQKIVHTASVGAVELEDQAWYCDCCKCGGCNWCKHNQLAAEI